MGFTDFEELSNSPTLQLGLGQSRARRIGKIPWNSINDFADYLFPAPGTQPPVTFPGFSKLFANSCFIEPFIGDAQKITSPATSNNDADVTNGYEFAKVTIEYETQEYVSNPGPDPTLLLQHRLTLGGEFLVMEGDGFEWEDGGRVKEEIKVGKLIPTIEHQVTWPRVKNPPFAVMRDRLGTVNQETINFSTGAIYPETSLFLGAELRRDILSTGELAWEVGYRFSERRVSAYDDSLNVIVGGWNHFYRQEGLTDAGTLGRTGFFRLQTQPIFGPDRTTVVVAQKPVYEIKTHAPLFVEA